LTANEHRPDEKENPMAAVVSGLGAAVPRRLVHNNEIGAELGVSDDWIFRRTGIRNRYVVEPGTATSDLAVEAGARALRSAGLTQVDAVVLATSTPDHQVPGTAPAVASRLGLTGAAAFDVNAVCTGFIYALAVGAGLIGSGIAQDVLVIGADTFSTLMDRMDVATRSIFGDGAGAMVLRAGPADTPGALNAFDLGSDGSQDDLIKVPGGGSRQRAGGIATAPQQCYLTMRGQELFPLAIHQMTTSCRAVLTTASLKPAAVDRVVGHQANIRILRMVAQQLGLPEPALVSNIDRVGNTSAASIPLALVDAVAEGSVEEGQLVLLTAFGAGLTWGSTVLTWPKILLADEDLPR
jgi:3-oxoacyl-[acyl-carrier-protein] synthase-3